MSLSDRIRDLPCWRGEPRAEPLSGGLSNENWKVTDDRGTYVVRFGADYPVHHVDRAREAAAARAAHRLGFGPRVVHAAPGVMVTDFIVARTWRPEDVRANPVRVARLLAGFHRKMPDEIAGAPYLFWPFLVIRDYARRLAGSPAAARLPDYLALSAEMERAQVPLPIVFGHHDLLPANFLDDGHRLWLIDYEYAGFGTAMFDLAGAASNAGMAPDEAGALLTAYFGAAPGPELIRAFDAMQVASLMREALWALVSEIHLAVPGVDYAAYADENFARLAEKLDRYRSSHGKPPP